MQGYGEGGMASAGIPPGSDLLFEITLLSIKKGKEPSGGPQMLFMIFAVGVMLIAVLNWLGNSGTTPKPTDPGTGKSQSSSKKAD